MASPTKTPNRRGPPYKRKKPPTVDGLNPRHKVVVDEYLSNGFRKDMAMRKAGYSEFVSTNHQAKLFGRQDVIDYIQKKLEKATKKAEVTVEKVVDELAKIAFFNLGDAIVESHEDGSVSIDVTRLSKEQQAALAEFTVEEYTEGRGEARQGVRKIRLKPIDKLGALDKLARYLGMYNDKLELTGEVSIIERIQAGRERARLDMVKREDGSYGTTE